MTDRKASNHGLLFFIRMYCSMPFIPDDRKLLCCQDAATEIEGRSNISIFQFESHWNELVKNEKRGKMKKNPLLNKGEQTKMYSLLLHFPFFFFFFVQQQQQHSEGFLLQQLQITCLASNVVRGLGLLQRQSFISQASGIIRAPFHLPWRKERNRLNII